MEQSKIYFPNINGIRFIAAMMVIIHHIEQTKFDQNIPNAWKTLSTTHSFYYCYPTIYIIGRLGVILFFVLSGFLITYLLLEENKRFDKIDIKKFYIRRILRIWPLYFLIIGLALFVLPHISTFSSENIIYNYRYYLLFSLFSPNIVWACMGNVPYASHTWSIGTEEQFYIIWPILVKLFKNKIVLLLFFILLLYLGIKVFLLSSYSDIIPYKVFISRFWTTFSIDCMAIGGIFAYLLFKKKNILRFFLNNYTFYIILIVTLLLLKNGMYIPNYYYEIYAFLFGIIILNFAANKNIHFSLENSLFRFLGTISYGLYMYQPLCIIFCIKLLFYFNIYSNLALYILSISLTIFVASISYFYFEKFFISYKSKFTKITSGLKAI
jgi:peptidoglycan/LPS O-acetylase OafA/YrhL